MNQPAETSGPEPVSDEDAAAAADDLAVAIAHERDLHRQSDTKATGAFAVVGLIIAATSTALPHLDGVPHDLVVVGLTMVAAAGLTIGGTLIPLGGPRRASSKDEAEQYALDRARNPHTRLDQHATELYALERITKAKHNLVLSGLLSLGLGANLIGLTIGLTLG